MLLSCSPCVCTSHLHACLEGEEEEEESPTPIKGRLRFDIHPETCACVLVGVVLCSFLPTVWRLFVGVHICAQDRFFCAIDTRSSARFLNWSSHLKLYSRVDRKLKSCGTVRIILLNVS